ncbi:MAG: hypothetical protein LE168_05625 [Endomicrobium sp.]|nr:hypothetical protein [Endomicrobium sp.]
MKEGKTVLLHMPLLYFAFQPKEKSIAPMPVDPIPKKLDDKNITFNFTYASDGN